MYYKAATLAKHLQHNYKSVPKRYIDSTYQQAENDWAVPQFLFRLLKTAKFDDFLVPENLERFHSQYESENGISIDLDLIKSKQWIRFVADDILIPGMIQKAIWKLENEKELYELIEIYEQEFLFISEIDIKVNSTRTLLLAYHSQYELKNEISIDINLIEKKKWIHFVEGNISIPDTTQKVIQKLKNHKEECEFMEEYKKELLFLHEIKSKACSIETSLLVSGNEVTSLVKGFQIAFPKMPDVEELVEKNILKKVSKGNQYSINRTNPYWEHFKNILAAHYWEFLIEDNVWKDDSERLIQWKRIFLMGSWVSPDFQISLKDTSRKAFIDEAFDLVISEPDLNYSKDEIHKWQWDKDRLLSGEIFSEKTLVLKLKPDTDSFFKCFFTIKEAVPFFLYVELQSARTAISCLIEQVLYVESQHFSEHNNAFAKTKELFKDSQHKPYFLWNLTCLLERKYPEAIPYTLTEQTTAAWGMWLLEQLEYQNDFKGIQNRVQRQLKNKQLISDIWLQGFEIVLFHLSKLALSKIDEQDVLFDILYSITYNSSEKILTERVPITQEYHARYLKAVELLENYRLEHYNSSSTSLKPLLYPYLLESLSERSKRGSIAIRRNEMKEFDIGIWQLNLLILHLCDKPLLSGEVDISRMNALQRLSKKTVKYIYDSFKKELQLKEVTTYEFFTEKSVTKLVRWWTEPMAMINLDWSLLVFKLEENGLLNKFLNLFELDLEDKDDWKEEDRGYQYWMDEYNQTQIKKQRIVLRVMLLMYESILLNEHFFLIKNINSKEVRQRLETVIIDISQQNENNHEDQKVDIFYSMFESSSFSSYGEHLLAHLFRVANDFHEYNRKKLIQSFEYSPLDRLLWIYNILGLPTERKIIEEAITNTDVGEFLKKTRWVNVLRNALIQSINSPLHIAIAEEIFAHEKENLKKFIGLNPMNEKILFEVEALILLKKEGVESSKRLKSLKDIPILKSEYSSNDIVEHCIRFKKLVIASHYSNQYDYSSAIPIFEELVKLDTLNYTYQAQLFNHRVAEQIGDNNPNIDKIESAFQDFLEFEKKVGDNSKESLRFADTTNYYKAVRSHFMKFDADFGFYIDKLSLPFLFDKFTLPFIIEHYAQIGQNEIADSFLEEARIYYQNLSEDASWLKGLNNKFDMTNIITRLQSNFNEILGRSARDLVKIIPPKLRDDKDTINDFILYQAIECATLLLETRLAIKPKENRYNDIFVGYLKSRLIPWTWSVPNEPPGGVSSSGKEPGERDWIIKSVGTALAFFEALIIDKRGKSYVKTHLRKLLGKYSATIKFGYLVVYYNKENDEFSQEWENYKKWIDSFQFSKPFSLIENTKELPEAVENYGTQNMKIALTKYGDTSNPIFIYHIYINMNYDIQSVS